MARKKISQLESATDVTANDLIQIVDVEDVDMAISGTNKKATAQLLANELGKITNVTATGGDVARSLVNRFADTVNVKDFGATGDGITNDTAAIQSCISSNEGKSIFFPDGGYVISSLTVPANTVLVSFSGIATGQTSGSVRLIQTGDESNFITLAGNGASISGMTIIGGGATKNTNAIVANATYNSAINCRVSDFGGRCLVTDASSALGNFTHITAIDNLLYRAFTERTGVFDIYGTAHTVSNCYADPSLTSMDSIDKYIVGFHISCARSIIEKCYATNSDVGFYISGAGRNMLLDSISRLNFADGVIVDSDYNLISSVGLHENSAQADNIYNSIHNTSSADNTTIVGCVSTSTQSNRVKYGVQDDNTVKRAKVVGFQAIQPRTADTNDVSYVGRLGFKEIQIPFDLVADSATPNINNYEFVTTSNYTTPTTITNFTGGVDGQILNVLATGGVSVTISNNTNIQTNTGANKTLVNNRVYSFRLYGAKWYEFI